jgi:hypothetical protein
MKNDRYEAFSIIIKSREDGQSWFDIFVDLVTETCEGGGGDCILTEEEMLDEDNFNCDNHEHTAVIECTCGMESAAGWTGTLSQCYKRLMPDEEWDEEL